MVENVENPLGAGSGREGVVEGGGQIEDAERRAVDGHGCYDFCRAVFGGEDDADDESGDRQQKTNAVGHGVRYFLAHGLLDFAINILFSHVSDYSKKKRGLGCCGIFIAYWVSDS